MRDLSILIPTYNDVCLPLVEQLKAQADKITGLQYEIIVADDGSTDTTVITKNRQIASIKNCRFIECSKNSGRAAIRNLLGKEAQYDWLVFLDCEVNPSENLIKNYAKNNSKADVICGGVSIGGDKNALKRNLRFRYEKSKESSYSARNRNKRGYRSFRTTNFMIKRIVFNNVQFNEEMKTYGYEDVVFGKAMKLYDFALEHIDNPVGMYKYETNNRFVEKTEESLRTLKTFSKEIDDFSPIITLTGFLKRWHLLPAVKKFFELTNKKFRTNLCGDNPKLLYYSLYKLGYFVCL